MKSVSIDAYRKGEGENIWTREQGREELMKGVDRFAHTHVVNKGERETVGEICLY